VNWDFTPVIGTHLQTQKNVAALKSQVFLMTASLYEMEEAQYKILEHPLACLFLHYKRRALGPWIQGDIIYQRLWLAVCLIFALANCSCVLGGTFAVLGLILWTVTALFYVVSLIKEIITTVYSPAAYYWTDGETWGRWFLLILIPIVAILSQVGCYYNDFVGVVIHTTATIIMMVAGAMEVVAFAVLMSACKRWVVYITIPLKAILLCTGTIYLLVEHGRFSDKELENFVGVYHVCNGLVCMQSVILYVLVGGLFRTEQNPPASLPKPIKDVGLADDYTYFLCIALGLFFGHILQIETAIMLVLKVVALRWISIATLRFNTRYSRYDPLRNRSNGLIRQWKQIYLIETILLTRFMKACFVGCGRRDYLLKTLMVDVKGCSQLSTLPPCIKKSFGK
jgi:hypothetical protein